MQQTLEDFYKVIRAAGINVSPSDTIETSRTVALVGYTDRNILKNAFQVSLAKSETEQDLVAECFECLSGQSGKIGDRARSGG